MGLGVPDPKGIFGTTLNLHKEFGSKRRDIILATKIINNSPVAIAAAINSINAGYNNNGYKKEIESFGECFGTDDFKTFDRSVVSLWSPVNHEIAIGILIGRSP